MQIRIRAFTVLIFAGSLAWARLHEALQAPQLDPQDPLKAVAVYNGNWHTDDEAFDTKYSKAGKESASINNHCWMSGEFYICHQEVTKPSGPVSDVVLYRWNEKDHLYDLYSVDGSGGEPYHGHLVIAGDTWTFGEAAADKNSTERWRTVNVFSGPDHITYRIEFSTDGGAHWTTTRQGKEARVAK